MKRIFVCLMVGITLFATLAQSEYLGENDEMKIKLTFEDKSVIVKMAENPAAEQFLMQLPATFEFIDFAGEEKISEFHRPVSLTNLPRGMIAQKGKMFIYVPWGNFGFFYKDHGKTIDKSLVELGEIESGLEYLQNQKGGFNAQIEVMEQD